MKKMDWIVETLQGPMERGEVVFGSVFPQELRARLEYEGIGLGQTTHDDMMDDLGLFYAPGVRVMLPNRGLTMGSQWSAPHMDLYEPGKAPTPDPSIQHINPQSALRSPRIDQAVSNLGFTQVVWDPQSSPIRLDYQFEP